MGSLWATAKNAARLALGIWEDASKLIHYGARGRGDIILEGAEQRAEEVVEFVSTIPERQAQALDKAEERLLKDDHFGAGDVYTDEFVAPTATLAVTVLEGTVRASRLGSSKTSVSKSAGELADVATPEGSGTAIVDLPAGVGAESVPVKFVNGKTYALLPSKGGTGPRRWQLVGGQTAQTSTAAESVVYDRSSLVRGDFRKNAEAVLERDPSCQYCSTKGSTTADHVISAYDVDSVVGAGILTREEAVASLNELSNLVGACRSCNSSKGVQLPGNVPGTWRPTNPTARAIELMRRLGTWSNEGRQ